MLLLPITAAAQFKYIPLNGQTEYESENGKKDIRIYLSAADIPKNHTKIGLIICSTNKDQKAIKKAQKKAAKYGADAIYMFSEADRTGMDKALNTLLLTNYKDKTKFVAIKLD